MKGISLKPFCVLVASLSTIVFAHSQGTLQEDFKSAFLSSIRGLDQSFPLSGFDRVVLVKNESSGVNTLRAEKFFPDADSAQEFLSGLTDQLAVWLPQGEYLSRRSFSSAYVGSTKTLFEFNSPKMADQQKRPSVELGIEQTPEGARLIMILLEPYFKGQYKPVMP